MSETKEQEFQEARKKLNEPDVKSILQSSIKSMAREEALKNLKASRIPDEKLEQCFAIVDVHTKMLDNMNTINNYNLTVQVISNLMTKDPTWADSEERCQEIIEDYLKVFIDEDQIGKGQDKDDVQELLRTNIKKFIIHSCMAYYAIFHKDRDLLMKYNLQVNDAIKVILQIMNASSITKVPTKKKPIPQEVMDELNNQKGPEDITTDATV